MLIHKSMTNCVCFVCCYGGNGDLRPVGTAFFIGTQIVKAEPPRWIGIAVTALHVINGIEDVRRSDKRIFLRVNTHDGGFDHVEIPSDEWIRPDHSDGIIDAAVCRFPHNNRDRFDYMFLDDEMIASRATLLAEDIGIGNEVFSAGLFIMHTNTKQNEPIVRSGTIAAIPETISSKSGPQFAYLVESRSIGGLSGSPVFVDAGLTRHDESGRLTMRGPGARASYLLGVISGHWNAEAEIQEIGDNIKREYINMGIAKITPMEKIIPLISECIVRAQNEVIEIVKTGVGEIAKVLVDGIKRFVEKSAEAQRKKAEATDAAPSQPGWFAETKPPEAESSRSNEHSSKTDD